MSAAFQLVDTLAAPAMGSSRRSAMPRSSLRPTLVPIARCAVRPPAHETQPPPTRRSASFNAAAAAQDDAYTLLAVMRMNVEFLETLLRTCAPVPAREALEDLRQSIDRLERRCASMMSSAAPRRVESDP